MKYFNSSMVRLKAPPVSSILGTSYHFNSSMVRLKAVYFQEADASTTFQFQYGAIKSHLILFASGLLSHFNSSMVRLKVWI